MAKTITKAATTAAVQPHEEAHKALAYRAAAESIVLLENDGVLPLKPGKVALFGAGAELTVKGGTGSGEVNERHSVSIAEGLEKAGFTNILSMWTKEDLFGVSIGTYMDLGGDIYFANNNRPSKTPIGTFAGTGVGVKTPWSYVDPTSYEVYGSDDFYPMVFGWLNEIYRWAVISSYGIPGEMTYAYIATGKQSPYQGQMGMMSEFAADAEGRSKCTYCMLSAMVVMEFLANLKLLGKWDYDAQTPETAKTMRIFDSRIYVGHMDLFFKLSEGYYGNSQSTSTYEDLATLYHYGTDVLQDMLYNFHNMDNRQVEVKKPDDAPVLEPTVEPMNGITKPPKGAVIAENRSHLGGYIDPRTQHIIDGKCYYEGTLEFDTVIGEPDDNDWNDVVMFGASNVAETQFGDYGMMISFVDGNIMVYNGDKGDYVATGVRFGGNYRFHFKIDFNCQTKRYDVTVTQTWPKTDKPVTATVKNCWFRDGDYYVDCVVPTNQDSGMDYWLENIKISGKTRAKTTYTPFTDVNVSIDWTDVPASERPSTVKAYLVFNGMKHPHKYVTLKASDGWKAKSFDHLPEKIATKEVEYSIYVEQQPGYASVISPMDKNSTIKITASKKPVIYENDFQSGELGVLVDAGAKSGAAAYFATEGSNKFLALDNKDKLKHQLNLTVDNMFMDGKLNSLYSVIFLEMDVRKVTEDSTPNGYVLGYRKDKTDGQPGTTAHKLISVSNNVLRVEASSKKYIIGNLTDDWQTLKVCYDVANNRALVSYGSDTNYYMVEDLPEIRLGSFYVATSENYPGLALDNMKVYCDNTKSIQSTLDSMSIDLKVNIALGSDVPAENIPGSVKVYLVANGVVTDKYVTLLKSENWKPKTFKDLQVLVDGVKQEYSLKPEYVYNVHTITEQVGNEATITICSKYTYYDNDFSSAKVEVADKKAQVLDKNGNVLQFNNAETAIAGSNPYLVFNNVTATIKNNAMQDARNVILKLRVKSDKFEVGGKFVTSYIVGVKDGSNVYANLVEIENVKGTVTCKFLGKKLCSMTEGEWINLEIRMDFENHVGMAKLNDGDWQYVYDCPERTANTIRFYANKTMTWNVDDLKVYTDATWTTGGTEKTTDVNAKVTWDDTPALDSVRVQLYCNGVAVSGKTLTLNAGNNWSGVFSNLPTKDTVGTKQVYTIKALDTASGYDLYITGNGYTINFTKMDYYYWNDFDGMTMTDANGSAPGTFSGSASYTGTDNVYAKYQGTVVLRNDAIKTAKNVMAGMKLKIDTMVAYASMKVRYQTASSANFELFRAEVNSKGTAIGLYLCDTKVGSMIAGQWYDFLIAYDQQKHEICLYVDGTLVGKPVAIEANTGDYIKLYANNTWDMDDLRVYTNPTWDWLGDTRTYEDKTVSVNWNGAAPALENVTIQLYANATAVDGKTLTLNAANNWTGIFENLPSHDDNGDELTYTVKQVETLPGYNTYLTGDGFTINYVKDTYYYWNDFAGSSMTDSNGFAPSREFDAVQYKGDSDIYMSVQGTSTMKNAAFATARNVVIGMKLKNEQLVARENFRVRYQSGDDANYTVLEIAVNSGGTAATVSLAGQAVNTITFEADTWYDWTLVIDKVVGKVFLLDSTGAELASAACGSFDGEFIKMYVSNDFELDNLRFYTDNDWDTLAQYTKDVTVNINWRDNDNALGYRPAEQVTAKLYADGVFVQDVIIYANGGWTATVQDLPMYNSNTGNEAVYTVTVSADNYVADCNGTDVTMMPYLQDAVVSKSVEIVWDDNDNALGYRPAEEVTVQLYADGVATGEPVKVKKADGWKYTFADLPQFNLTTCTAYAYTVKIANVDYYVASYQGDQIVMTRFVKLTQSVVTIDTPFAD